MEDEPYLRHVHTLYSRTSLSRVITFNVLPESGRDIFFISVCQLYFINIDDELVLVQSAMTF